MALYNIGPVEMDTRPFNVDAARSQRDATFASKPVIGRRPPKEKTGEGEERLVLSGQLLPTKTGGLSSLDMLDRFRLAQDPLPVMRGDGQMMGWFIIKSIAESHKHLNRNGVGFVVTYSVRMERGDPSGAAIVPMILSLFRR